MDKNNSYVLFFLINLRKNNNKNMLFNLSFTKKKMKHNYTIFWWSLYEIWKDMFFFSLWMRKKNIDKLKHSTQNYRMRVVSLILDQFWKLNQLDWDCTMTVQLSDEGGITFSRLCIKKIEWNWEGTKQKNNIKDFWIFIHKTFLLCRL